MSKPLPVIAAIPNYNMADSLSELLLQVIAQGYDAIYVLDDASTDNSRQVVERFAPAVTWVASSKNSGAGAARNHILQAHASECIIHFLDADVHLETTNIPAKARKLMQSPNIGFVGGLVREVNGKQNLWNYGPALSLYGNSTAQIQYWFGNIQAQHPWGRKLIRTLTKKMRTEWPDSAVEPQERPTFWVIESNFFILRSTLASLGGFDESIREHDIVPLALAAYRAGLVSYFDPSVAVIQTEVKVRQYNRYFAKYRTSRYIIRTYIGRKQWLLPDGHLKPRYNQ